MADAPTTPTAGGLDGAQRAAVLLMSLGEEEAAEVLKHMGPKEVQKLGAAMAATQNVSREQVEGVVRDFLETVGTHTALGVDSEAYIRRVLVQALGEEKAGSVIDRILLGTSAQGLENLKWMEPRAVAELIRNEHPQIIAIVLSHLDSDHAADVLTALPEKVRPDLMMRIATLDTVQPAALQELNEMLERQVSGTTNLQTATVGGIRTASEILNFVDSSLEGEIVDEIKNVDADLGQQIQDLMFVFENLLEVDDAGIQALLREVSSDTLLVALKGADQATKDKFFQNMSKRASEMLRDDLEAKGPVRLSEVELAQKEIVSTARRMAEEGQLALGGKGGDEFV